MTAETTGAAALYARPDRAPAKERLVMGVPNHVLIIPDNNRTWARENGKTIREGYDKGAQRIIEVANAATRIEGLDYLTVNLVSADNIRGRPTEELADLWGAIKENMIDTGLSGLIDNGARIRLIGNMEGVPDFITEGFLELSERSKGNTGLALTFVLGYDSMQEKRDALNAARKEANWRKKILQLRHRQKLTAEFIESHKYLQAAGLPDTINAVIRTGDEERTSGIFPDPIAKAELLFVKGTTWPEFGEDSIEHAIAELASRSQKGGG